MQSVLVKDGEREGEIIKDFNGNCNEHQVNSTLEPLNYLKPRRGRMLWKKGRGRNKSN